MASHDEVEAEAEVSAAESPPPPPGSPPPPPASSSPVLSVPSLPPVNQFSMLSASTNLNAAPPNWPLPHPTGAERLLGFCSTVQRSHFSSLGMASRFSRLVLNVDVMADAEIIKKLLKMAYSSATISMVVHRVGRTLLIDDFDIHGFLLRTSEREWKRFRSFFMDTLFRSKEERNKALVRRKTTANAISKRNLVSKFLYRSLADGRREVRPRSVDMKADVVVPVGVPPLPEPSMESRVPSDPGSSSSSPHEFARNLIWNFEDIRMLIGSDMPIFGDADHPSVSLRLHEADRPINILTGLDYWLDNLMCQVPEVLMCFHLDGIVQNYELIKTEELPNMDGCKFSPRVVRDVARNILSFLKNNAAKEGHTYWLFKGKDDDVVKLYDLTSLCDGTSTTIPPGAAPSTAPKDEKEAFQNPFRTAVSMLLYNVALNITRNQSSRRTESSVAMQLLSKCLTLLDLEKYPHIASSAHFLLSDLYIPDGTDPSNPKFENGMGGESSFADIVEDGGASDSTKVIDMTALMLPGAVTFDKANSATPAPLPAMETRQRCLSALSHIVKGLQHLQYLARRREEDLEEQRRRKEREERDNIKVADASQAIPMGYDDPSNRKVEVYRSDEETRPSLRSLDKAAPSWHDHLKRVLFKKAFLVYLTLAEGDMREKKYGQALRCVKRALNCHSMVEALKPSQGDEAAVMEAALSAAHILAGDLYCCIRIGWDRLVDIQEEYNSFASDDDAELAEEVEKMVDESRRDFAIKLPQDVEEVLVLALSFLQRGLDLDKGERLAAGAEKVELLRKLGNVCNQLVSLYTNQMQALVMQPQDGVILDLEALGQMRQQVQLLLEQGLTYFRGARDVVNEVILLLNSGKLCRVFAHGYRRATGESKPVTQAEIKLHQDAFKAYETAKATLKSRKRDPNAWNMVRREHSTALVNLADLLRDCSADGSLERAEVVRLLSDTYDRQLKMCAEGVAEDTGYRFSYQVRAAMARHGLGNLHHSSWLVEADARRAAQLKRLAEQHYEKAVAGFVELEDHEDMVQSRLSLAGLKAAELDAAATGGAAAKKRVFAAIFNQLAGCIPLLESLGESGGLPDATDAAAEKTLSLVNGMLKSFKNNLHALNNAAAAAAVGKKGAKAKQQEAVAANIKELFERALYCSPRDKDFLSSFEALLREVASTVNKNLIL